MQKSVVFIIAAAFFFVLILVNAYSQEDMTQVDNSVFSNPQRAPAVFNHEEHNETADIEECSECHHVYDEDGQKIEDESSEDMQCAECHEENSSGRQPALDKAFHVNCMGCHLEQKKGPILCGECHIKQ